MALKKIKPLLVGAAILLIATSSKGSVTAASMEFSRSLKDVSRAVSEKAAEVFLAEVEKLGLDEEETRAAAKEIASKAKGFAKSESLGDFVKASVVRVVDGDTIVVNVEGTGDVTVRLIGVDTPESVASKEYLERTGKENTDEGKTASAFTKKLLESCEYVYLEKDVSETDRYGRALRYVWLSVPSTDVDLAQISTLMLNGILVSEGYAKVAAYEPDVKYSGYLEAIQDMALAGSYFDSQYDAEEDYGYPL